MVGVEKRMESDFHRTHRLLLVRFLSARAGYRYPYLEDPLLDAGTVTSASQVLFSSLLKRYAARNCECQPSKSRTKRQYHPTGRRAIPLLGKQPAAKQINKPLYIFPLTSSATALQTCQSNILICRRAVRHNPNMSFITLLAR